MRRPGIHAHARFLAGNAGGVARARVPGAHDAIKVARSVPASAGPARLLLRALASAQQKACILLFSAALAPAALAVPTPPGTHIDNQARVNLTLGPATLFADSNVERVTTVDRANTTPATITFYQHAPTAPTPELATAGPTSCDIGGGSFVTTPDPHAADGSPLDPLSPLPLTPGDVFSSAETLFIKVADADHNLNPAALDTILVTVSVASTGDSETLILTETGVNTGEFMGYIRPAAPPGAANDCFLNAGTDAEITATYLDFSGAVVTDLALVDPYGVVFDSITGTPIDGATVTLIDTATGLPATVFGDDGVASYPASVVSGTGATDGNGGVYTFGPGQYRFPFVHPGNYQLVITPPAGYVFPSVVPDASLPPGFAIEVGSRGEIFVVLPGPALHIDVPLDPVSGSDTLFVRKTTSTAEAAIGDFIEWRVAVQNAATVAATGTTLVDVLPQGVAYRPGSARLDGATLADPTISNDGRTLTFAVGTVPAGATVTVTYVTQVGPGVRARLLTNSAEATATGGVTSNVGSASVRLKEDLFGERATLIGEVLQDSCAFGTGTGTGVAGVRILLEDGTYAVTDERGRYHFKGVSEGAHVVQLDLASLPEGYEVELCEDNTRFAGRAYSQFVELQRGALWRADFRVRRPDPSEAVVRTRLSGSVLADSFGVGLFEFDFSGSGEVPLANLRLSFVVPDGATLVEGSAVLDGAALADARLADGVMTLRLGDRPAKFAHKVAFRLQLPEGEQQVRGVLTFDSPLNKNLRPTPVVVTLKPVAAELALEQGRVLFTPHFPSRSWTLTEQDRAALRRIAANAEDLKNLRLHIAGFTDGRRVRDEDFDDLKDNDDLSRRRADAVADFLAAELGIPRARITTEGRGEREPIGDNQRRDGQQLNRRVVITVVGVQVKGGEDSAARSAEESLRVTGLRPGESRRAEGGAPATTATPSGAGARTDHTVNYAPYARAVDGAFLATLEPGHALLWPAADVNPAVPAIKIAVQTLKDETVELTLNGAPVPATSISGLDRAADRDVAVRQWAGVDLVEGPNLLTAVVRDASGVPVVTLERTIHYSTQAVRAELVPERSALAADGRSRPRLAVRLFDRYGRPVRPGASGEFDVGAPYRAWRELDDRAKDKLFTTGEVNATWSAGEDGIAIIELAPTTDAGEVQLRFRFGDRQVQTLAAWLEPAARDWVLVGLAEGTAGYNAVSQNATAFTAAGGQPDYYQDGRVAFYAKGMVKGDTLLTLAYDTSKDRQTGGANLEQQIDPNAYYLLYGDATEQRNDAASLRNLYVRVERKQFYAMFGDFDTALTVTELGRYSRRMNGVKSEYRGKTFQYSAFASEDTTSFNKDEIQGDGTSGLYRLSRRPVVVNSEHVRIQVRDRFRSEVIVSEQTLTRHIDYTIDYTGGTLFFRKPVPSRDASFNPVFIVADYEVQSTGEGTFSGGGRGAVTLADGKVELGATAIHEGVTGADGDLVAADLTVKIKPGTELKAEVGTSDTGGGTEGTAYAVKVEHQGETLAGRAYVREQEAGFGIGQQSGGESGTRKAGVEGTVKIDQGLEVTGQAYVQQNLETGAERQVVDAALRFTTSDGKYTATGGLRHAAEDIAGDDLVSDQVYAGGSARVTDDLTLRAQGEVAVNGDAEATNFPDRITVGADYKLNAKATAFVEHEISQGAAQDTEMTRIGVRTQPWDRARADAAMEQQYSENGARLFATVGLGQGWQVSDDLLLDFGVDRVQTLRAPGDPDFDVDVPPAFGSDPNGDFTAWHVGATYRKSDWTMNGRLETFAGDLEDRWAISAGAYRAQGERWGVSFRLNWMDSETTTGATSTQASLSTGIVYRPTNSQFVWLDRVDLVYDDAFDPLAGPARTWKLINNLNLNHRPVARWQTSYQYAFKYVRADFGTAYTGFTDLVGIESRYDITREWDVGGQLYALHAWDLGTVDYALGFSVGHSFAKNVWLSVGYNLAGFYDEDFAGARYTAQGPFIQFRVKFDQDSWKDLKPLLAPAPAAAPTATPAPAAARP